MKASFSLALFCTMLWLTNCQQSAEKPAAETAPPKEDPVKHGEYLSNILGCDDCHTPKTMTPQGPVPDMTRRFMGHPADEPFEAGDLKKSISERFVGVFSPGMTAAAGPWGISYAANITPDDTGIGSWTEAQFIKAIREGKSKGRYTPAAAAHALAQLRQNDGRRPEGLVRLHKNDEAHQKRRSESENAVNERVVLEAALFKKVPLL